MGRNVFSIKNKLFKDTPNFSSSHRPLHHGLLTLSSITFLLLATVIFLLHSNKRSVYNPPRNENLIEATQVYTSQVDCENTTGKRCFFQMCDYKCPANFRKGWVPTDEIIEKDITANWNTYTNNKYGFELKYPPEWQVTKNTLSDGTSIVAFQDQLENIGPNSNNPQVAPWLLISISNTNAKQISLNEAIDKYSTCIEVYSESGIDYTIENSKGRVFENTNCGQEGGKSYLFTINDNNVYELSWDAFKYDINDKKINQILSTFKFIGNGSSVLTLRELNFSIPDNWESNPGRNQFFPIDFVDIKPSNSESTSNPPFSIVVETKINPSLQREIDAIKSTWHLTNTSEVPITKSGISGMVVTGVCNPGDVLSPSSYCGKLAFNKKGGVVIFVLDNDVYSFLGTVENHSSEFNQILSTFEFTD